MKHLVAVSPHLDDAAFSAGGTLAKHAREGWRVTVITCFTGNVARPQGFALACQLDKGLGPEIDYMALRRDEDLQACKVLGAEAVHLPLLEAPHRGYDSAPALFGARLASDDATAQLTPLLHPLVAHADRVLGPLAIGDHVDHHVVRDALIALRPDALLWEDWPYADRVASRGDEPAWRVALDTALVDARINACACYRSQLGFQFGSEGAMRSRLERFTEERFHLPPSVPRSRE